METVGILYPTNFEGLLSVSALCGYLAPPEAGNPKGVGGIRA